MNLTLQTQLTLQPLYIRKDQKHYIVEDVSSGDFFEMPQVCIDAIELINQGVSLEQIEVQLKTQYPNETIDMVDFVAQLLELNLVKEVDGETIEIQENRYIEKGFTWIPTFVGRFFFNKFTNKIYAVLFTLNLLFFILNPQLFPSYKDVFIFETVMPSLLLYMGVSLVLVLIHEFGHILAVRSYNLPAKLGVGHRLFLVVFETDLTPAWKLSSKQRNILYFGGMCFDQLLLFIALSLQLFFDVGHGIVLGILGLVVLDVFIRTIYQCCFYMKTDLYYFFENFTGCYNVMENGRERLRKWLPFIKGSSTTEAFEGEDKVIKFYSIFYITGILLTCCLFIFYFIPQTIHAYIRVLPGFLEPINDPVFWDATVFTGQSLLILGLLMYSWKKNRAENY
ncbi:peptidase [Alkalihalobacterium elongatum]|uniref:peptidase n=1 Tax=Alkalihalobacterium elongatum TaxID=2675466 RepID=UPI001C1F9921|nr:peptidase [Alkalihalobacterium elongatum]